MKSMSNKEVNLKEDFWNETVDKKTFDEKAKGIFNG